ncbi:MAG: AMP-binding enzyme family protein [Bradyrhizobium sp.]|nr:AMP-binding enzyme family protein [Bradyrhizobium sp.]
MTTLQTIVRKVMTLDPAAPAIEFRERWHSWGEMTAIGEALDRVFAANSIAPGTRIGGILRNTPEIAAMIISVIAGERCMVTLNPTMPDDRLAADIRLVRVPVVIASADDWARADVRSAAEEVGVLGIELTGKPAEPVRVLMTGRGGDFHRDAAGVGIEMLTSGTTGTPKRIPLKAANFSKMILDAAIFESRKADDVPRLSRSVSILNTPFSHIGGLVGLFICLTAGRKACLLDRFQVASFVDAVARHRPKVASAPPSALRMILDADTPVEKLASLMVFRTGTAPLDPDLADAFQARYGIPVLQNYGATEFAGGVAGWTMSDYQKYGTSRRGSVGRMNPGVEGRVVSSETDEPVSSGESGLLELRAAHLGDGASWMRTTDIARMDDEQFLWILGRADNAIIRGGFKILPDDVVRAIEAHPSVLEASVLPLPDRRLGQIPVAAFTVKSGESLEADELKTFLRERLAAYQVPAQILRVAELPRTPSMKISQPELAKLFEVI